jgi:hypothetical protein
MRSAVLVRKDKAKNNKKKGARLWKRSLKILGGLMDHHDSLLRLKRD